MEALQKRNEDIKQPTFHRKRGIIVQKLKPEVPGLIDEGIHITKIKPYIYETGEFKDGSRKRPRKQSSSSVLKSLSILLSHIRGASYVLVIVTIYLATWTPFLVYSVSKTLTRTIIMNQQVDKVSDTARVNVTLLKSCLADALQDQSCYIQEENVTVVEDFTKIIQ